MWTQMLLFADCVRPDPLTRLNQISASLRPKHGESQRYIAETQQRQEMNPGECLKPFRLNERRGQKLLKFVWTQIIKSQIANHRAVS